LGHTTRFLKVRCLAKDIPANISIDVTNLGLDESILLENVQPPAGVTFLDNKHTVLAHVSEVAEEKAPDPAAAAAGAAGTPEVITEKKKEGEEGAAAAPAAGAAKPGDKGKAAPAAAAAPAAKADAKKK
jgi:large subunit ribosomal protein L25